MTYPHQTPVQPRPINLSFGKNLLEYEDECWNGDYRGLGRSQFSMQSSDLRATKEANSSVSTVLHHGNPDHGLQQENNVHPSTHSDTGYMVEAVATILKFGEKLDYGGFTIEAVSAIYWAANALVGLEMVYDSPTLILPPLK
ncbi:alpha/beta-Hydrolases superfamily protein [Striga asiatica]|uniref:Alpha/beta-Hydrolases superfamily protein n=1 Tax=Striga asiatica TaxID=4170 RepID=A0A5A7PUV8_STRAF|nr:alpha/beta-Hydrolases superfamily protein [Striga asiatica]